MPKENNYEKQKLFCFWAIPQILHLSNWLTVQTSRVEDGMGRKVEDLRLKLLSEIYRR